MNSAGKISTFFGLISIWLPAPAFAASDAELSRALLGSWIVPLNSSDANAENTKTLETFRANGTYIWSKYDGEICGKLVKAVTVAWVVRDAVLLQRNESGKVMRDKIVSITDRSLTLHSLDDGTTYTRIKASGCSARGKPSA